MSNTPLVLGRKPRRDDVMVVEITDLDEDGAGLARVPAVVGPQRQQMVLAVHARGAVPGDEVEVEVTSTRRRRVDARITQIVDPSPMRITPRCVHFTQTPPCGGCVLQTLDHRHQLMLKERHLAKLLKASGTDPGLIEPVRATDDAWRYRNKMEFSAGRRPDGSFSLGLHPKGYRYDVVDQRECHIVSAWVSELLPSIADWFDRMGIGPRRADGTGWVETVGIREGMRTGGRLLDLVTSGDAEVQTAGEPRSARAVAEEFAASVADRGLTSVWWTQHHAQRGVPTRWDSHHLAGTSHLRERLKVRGRELTFEIHPRAFFQTNTAGAELLYETVADLVPSGGRVIDLYCGTGTIALCLAPFVQQVVGVELVEEAVDNARRNAELNGLTNAEFIAGDAAEVLAAGGLKADVLVVDPPRAGLRRKALDQIESVGASELIYVSCNPVALARNLPELAALGWEVAAIRPVDLFPQTFHVETVVHLRKPNP